MCGIAGFLNWGSESELARMTDLQKHRGPDDRGTWTGRVRDGGSVGLGSRRLAILDLSTAGHMPMSTPDGRLTIVYNGEVYNYRQIRNELEAKGYRFRSTTDTEAILYLFQEYGAESVRRLNGMFALAIWDAREEELFLARDHFGIKPLYYTTDQGKIAFASEIKSLLALPGVGRGLNYRALDQYLTFLWVPDPLTMFDRVLKLPAGHFARFRGGHIQLERYWDLTFPDAGHQFTTSQEDLIEGIRERFLSTVRSQMASDVPIGSFLSAGLDSSGIVAAMARSSTAPVRTYTITFPEKYRVGQVSMDDPHVAARTAQHFGCLHTEIMVDPDVVALLPKLVWHMDEPIADPAILTAYLVSRKRDRP